MSESIHIISRIIWTLLLLYWVLSGIKNKQTKSQQSVFERVVLYWFPIIVSLYLLGPEKWFEHTLLRGRFLPHHNSIGIIGLLFVVTGMVIACWARYLLGKNWSFSVQKKKDHELITKGVYKIVRHPIYTGLLLMFVGHTIIVGEYRGLIAVLIIFISFYFKLRKEETWLIELFGDKYLKYQNKTKAIIPFLL
ncbi:MAG: isoprenylcysteine carboxylmethyltransferase family protein [Bacteroidota bacterium]